MLEQSALLCGSAGKHEISALWKQGLARTVAVSICVRTVCFLCGSAGKHEVKFTVETRYMC